jgi:hypothetical protein
VCRGAVVRYERTVRARGLHSYTLRLNVRAFSGIGGAFRGWVGGVWAVSRSCEGASRGF